MIINIILTNCKRALAHIYRLSIFLSTVFDNAFATQYNVYFLIMKTVQTEISILIITVKH